MLDVPPEGRHVHVKALIPDVSLYDALAYAMLLLDRPRRSRCHALCSRHGSHCIPLRGNDPLKLYEGQPRLSVGGRGPDATYDALGGLCGLQLGIEGINADTLFTEVIA
ncbi:hypothetical protein [Agrobacterium salinitolerans]|uniref:hypothetical protein n=1 Tax=Agrobacterium salinitolerans TaxID=1183413 RepID=UPI001FCE55B5|nr:hypothetical protein [Agrobacterium salinitolerans]